MKNKQIHKRKTSDDPRIVLGRLFKQTRTAKDLTQRELEKECKVSPSTISRIENGSLNSHDAGTVKRVIDWLQHNLSDPDDQAVLQNLINLGISFNNSEEIPYYVGVHAGSPGRVDNQPVDYWDLTDKLNLSKEKIILVEVVGDSMIDEMIFEGDVLVVERVKAPKFRNGEIVIAEVDREFTVKKYCIEKEKPVLCTANSSKKGTSKEYDDIDETSGKEVKLVGRVTYSLRQLKAGLNEVDRFEATQLSRDDSRESWVTHRV